MNDINKQATITIEGSMATTELCLRLLRYHNKHSRLNSQDKTQRDSPLIKTFHVSHFFYLPICCSLSEDIQQSCLNVTIVFTDEIHPVIYLLLAIQSQLSLVVSYMRLVDHIRRRTTVGRTPLDK